VMTYDINGSARSGITNFNAAFGDSSTDPRDDDERHFQNVTGTIAAFTAEGAPPAKLVVGMPFYGRGFSGVPDVNHGLYQPFADTFGTQYHTIVADYLPTYARHWHDEAEVPWLYDPATGTMVSYDDPESLGRKADFINARGLGGAMFWELSGDDEDLSLLNALASRLLP
ncbi:MAG TPA: glycoside hydrolase family 18 protein, partial [Thermomicrobiales bacterium]|nr:glycoside hydrolase family 18 protein [Thermomicrobiales bacterium]